MKTSKPFSTISYNTDKFLKDKLDRLIKRDCISFYAWVEHYAEDDEKKNHKHLYIVPNGQQETNGIRDILEELDPNDKLGKPLKCLDFKSSKFDDWYLYCCHDTGYLATKGQTRKYHYKEDDFVTSSEESLHERIATIDYAKYRKTQDFVDAVMRGVSFYDLVRSGQVPAPQFMQWRNMYQFLVGEVAYRAGRETHTPVDPETGEVMDQEDYTTG